LTRASSGEEWVWGSYVDGHEPVQKTVVPEDPLAKNDAKQDAFHSLASSPHPTRPKSSESRDSVTVMAQESNSANRRQDRSGLNDQPKENPVRERLTKLFEFLRAYVDLRFPPVRDIRQQPRFVWLKDLPIHPSVELFRDAGKPIDDAENNDIILRLTRPTVTRCPSPPHELADWLNPDWQELSGKAEVRRSRNVVEKGGQTLIERFDDDAQRPLLLRTWRDQRDQWLVNERPARQSLALFQTVYEWFGVQEREGERMELLLGDGLLRCPDPSGEFCHPVLLQKVELEFYPERNNPSLSSESGNNRQSFTWNSFGSCLMLTTNSLPDARTN
jgi:hypothetical protein